LAALSLPEATPQPEAGDPRRSPLTAGERRWLAGIVVVAAVARIGWFAATKAGPPVAWHLQGDQYGYWFYANEIAAGRGYVHYLTGEPTAYYPVGYPALLAVLFALAIHTPITDDLMLVAGVFHVVASVVSVALTFVVGRRLLGVRAGLVAAAVLALWPNVVFQVSALQLETAFIVFAMAALAVLVDHDWRTGPPSRVRLLVFGALLAASAMIRPFSVWVLVGVAVATVSVAGGWRAGWRSAASAVGWPLLVLVVVFTPWTIRNAVQLDTFAPSSTNMGDGLCLDRYPGATGGFRWADHDFCADSSLPEAERNQESTRLAVAYVLDHPGREVVQWWRRLDRMLASDSDGVWAVDGIGPEPAQFSPDARRRLEDLADSFFVAVLWLAVPGLVLAARRAPRPERWLAGSMFVGLLAVPLLLYGNPRFHVPLAPFGAIAAAATVTALAGALAGAVRRPHPEPADRPPSPGSALASE
jgi:4-amino-4-deoxy-L-arabinose transferase-like glycosyltransferase